MNKKAELGLVGIMLVTAISIIVGLAFYTEIDLQVGNVITTAKATNQTFIFPAAGGTIELNGQNIVGSMFIQNVSGAYEVPSTNYSVAQGIGLDGLTATILTAKGGFVNGKSVNGTYTYEPDGYVSNASRTVTLLIVVFSALAIAVVALTPTLRNGVLDLID
jgi:hypothetical protein